MPIRMLVAYSMSSTHVQTTLDYLRALKFQTGYEVSFVHVTHDANVAVDLAGYDVIFHNYCARLCFDGYVSDSYLKKLKNFRGLKILSVQDEYNRTNAVKRAIVELGFDIVLTCVPQDSLEFVYPKQQFPDTEFVTVLTGYVPEDFSEPSDTVPSIRARPIHVGYRGRDIGGLYGRLGFDKYEIGRKMREICESRGIPHDIAMDEASRIYGRKWFEFIGSCRAMLGSESGSNIFDFDGSIEDKFRKMTKENGGRPPSYAEFEPYVTELERNIAMGQISPRVFECALMRTPMILFRGRYSDAIEPGAHYILLEKDFSNVDRVLEELGDVAGLEAMAERTYQHLVASGTFGYRAFCKLLTETIDRTRASQMGVIRAADGLSGADSINFGNRERVLMERATDLPGGLDELNTKLYCAGLVSRSRSQRRTMVSLFSASRRYIASIRAHIDLINKMIASGCFLLEEGQGQLCEDALEVCLSFEMNDVPQLKKLRQKREDEEERDEQALLLEEASLLSATVRRVAFFHQSLLDLHDIATRNIHIIARRQGALQAARWALQSLYALAKAPPRAFASGILRKYPRARSTVNKLRGLTTAT